MKLFACLLVLLLLTSCSYRTLESGLKPVYFSPDTVVFTDTLARVQAVYYENLMRLSHPCLEMVELHDSDAATAFISKPTFFTKDGVPFLIYPREHILISANISNGYAPIFSTASKDKTRDGELLMLKTFQELEKRPKFPYRLDYTLMLNYTFQTILDLEKEVKAQIAPSERASQVLFDSLCTVYHVSQKFKELTKDYVHNRYDAAPLALYETYRDTLLAHHVYQSKVKALLPEVNGLTKTSQFNLNLEDNTNYIYACLFPDRGIRNMVTVVGGFEACFDSVVTNFKGPARDYLLSRIMYRTYSQGVRIPSNYRKKYRHYSINKVYRKIVFRAARQMKHSQSNTSPLPNVLLMAYGKTKTIWEDVLAKYKGKYVLVDLWASWCVPCIEEMPAWQALREKYSADKIAFLTLSVDKSVLTWHNRLYQLHGDSLTNYLLLNQENSVLAKQIGLTSIPRYLLYDQEGRLIDTDAPAPSDPKLGEILDKLLLSRF
jgi:thiol-disulfide isomerase/thioredoxin